MFFRLIGAAALALALIGTAWTQGIPGGGGPGIPTANFCFLFFNPGIPGCPGPGMPGVNPNPGPPPTNCSPVTGLDYTKACDVVYHMGIFQ